MRRVRIIRIRSESGSTGVFGDLTTDSGFQCYTLERPETGDHPCIPAGTYKAVRTNHLIHGLCYELQAVRDRTAILIHSANWFFQLLGCIAPGRSIDIVEGVWEGKAIKMKGVTSSKDALGGLLADLEGETFELTISWDVA